MGRVVKVNQVASNAAKISFPSPTSASIRLIPLQVLLATFSPLATGATKVQPAPVAPRQCVLWQGWLATSANCWTRPAHQVSVPCGSLAHSTPSSPVPRSFLVKCNMKATKLRAKLGMHRSPSPLDLSIFNLRCSVKIKGIPPEHSPRARGARPPLVSQILPKALTYVTAHL